MAETHILPFLVFLNSLPKIAVAPLFMIWFGYGILPNILIVFLISFFPVVINTATGLVAVEEDLLDLVNYLHATKWQKMRKIQLPNSLPYIFSGLKIAATTAVTGAIVGEFVASDKGLGSVIISSQTTLATPVIFGSLILITVIGMALFGFVGMMERLLMPWKKNDKGGRETGNGEMKNRKRMIRETFEGRYTSRKWKGEIRMKSAVKMIVAAIGLLLLWRGARLWPQTRLP